MRCHQRHVLAGRQLGLTRRAHFTDRVIDNASPESVFLTADGGASWSDVTANLREASGTIGQVRPSALLLVGLSGGRHALLVGTVNGVLVTFLGGGKGALPWVRLGGCAALPLVLVAGLSYEPKDDTILAATMGRGIYAAHGAARELEQALAAQVAR